VDAPSSEIVLSEERLLPALIRSEVNLLNLPFFGLWDKDVHRKTTTEYKTTLQRGGERQEILWRVTGDTERGYPGPFERKLYRAIEYIISELTPPIENPIRLGSLSDLANLMGFKKQNGSYESWVYKRIREALLRLRAARVYSKGTFYAKASKQWIEDDFSIYERIVFSGKETIGGVIAESNYLFLGSWYLENLNARYVRPLDFSYYKSFKTNIGSRLYELLGVKFYGLSKGQALRYRYSTICQLLPTTRQRYLSLAKRILDPGHEELKSTHFLSDYQWEPIAGEKGDWYLHYWPGQRAMDKINGRVLEQPESAEGGELKLTLATPDPESVDLWKQVLMLLQGQLPRPTFATHLSNTHLLELKDGSATIMVDSQFDKEWLERRMYQAIVRALSDVLDYEVKVEFVVSQMAERRKAGESTG
jgi:hypothetical protein